MKHIVREGDVTYQCEVAELDGVREVVEFTLSAPRVSGAMLRAVPFRRLRRSATAAPTVLRVDSPTDREVAEVWHEARRGGVGGTEAVRRTWGVSRSTASNWVRDGRALGLIPPVPPNRRNRRQ